MITELREWHTYHLSHKTKKFTNGSLQKMFLIPFFKAKDHVINKRTHKSFGFVSKVWGDSVRAVFRCLFFLFLILLKWIYHICSCIMIITIRFHRISIPHSFGSFLTGHQSVKKYFAVFCLSGHSGNVEIVHRILFVFTWFTSFLSQTNQVRMKMCKNQFTNVCSKIINLWCWL